MDINFIPLNQNNSEQFAVFCELLTEYDAEIDEKPLDTQDQERIKRIAKYIIKCADRENSWVELLYAQNKSIGFMFYEIDDGSYGAPETLGYGFIREFYIRPEYRKQGLGTGCYKKIEDTFQKHAVKQIWLTCETETGAPFWSSLGFVNTEKRCQKNDIDIYVKPIGFTRVEKELSHFGVRFNEIQELQAKDGVFVYRIKGEIPCVL
jgi:GNAT superfamily N-acetyltransferase